jgi:hypothetical protein
MRRSRRTPAPHGARAPRTRRTPPSGDAPVAGGPVPVDSPAAFDDRPDGPSTPATVRDSEQAPDSGRAGEESVRETGEDSWTDAERGGSPPDAP